MFKIVTSEKWCYGFYRKGDHIRPSDNIYTLELRISLTSSRILGNETFRMRTIQPRQLVVIFLKDITDFE